MQVRYQDRDGHEGERKQPHKPAVDVEEVGAALVEFIQPSAPGAKVRILELEFFDDQRMVIVYKLDGQAGESCKWMVGVRAPVDKTSGAEKQLARY